MFEFITITECLSLCLHDSCSGVTGQEADTLVGSAGKSGPNLILFYFSWRQKGWVLSGSLGKLYKDG